MTCLAKGAARLELRTLLTLYALNSKSIYAGHLMRMPKDLEKNRSQDSTRSLLSHRLRCRETKMERTSHGGDPNSWELLQLGRLAGGD